MAYLPFAPGAHLVRLGLTGGDFDRGVFLLALFQGLFLFAAGLLAMVYMYRMVRRWGILGRF
jgi:ABC-2 type transport system permease protein